MVEQARTRHPIRLRLKCYSSLGEVVFQELKGMINNFVRWIEGFALMDELHSQKVLIKVRLALWASFQMILKKCLCLWFEDSFKILDEKLVDLLARRVMTKCMFKLVENTAHRLERYKTERVGFIESAGPEACVEPAEHDEAEHGRLRR